VARDTAVWLTTIGEPLRNKLAAVGLIEAQQQLTVGKFLAKWLELRKRWFYTFPGIRLWHRWQPDGPIETRTLAGRRRLNVERFTEKLNTPVQGTGADGLKNALALLWETRQRCPSAQLVLVVHDEIVVECDEQEAVRARKWLVESMQKGMSEFLQRVPVDVEAKVCRDWSVAD
jgi:DNA polymerase-1